MDEGEGDEGEVDDVKFVVAGEDTPVGFEPAEESFDLVASFVYFPVICPRVFAVAFGRDHRFVSQLVGQLSGFVAFVGSVG